MEHNHAPNPELSKLAQLVVNDVHSKIKNPEINKVGKVGWAVIMVTPGTPDLIFGSNCANQMVSLGLVLDTVQQLFSQLRMDYNTAANVADLADFLETIMPRGEGGKIEES